MDNRNSVNYLYYVIKDYQGVHKAPAKDGLYLQTA